MSVEELLESPLGPFPFDVWTPKVREFIAATGDDPTRWEQVAPPGYAAAVLFAGATPFLTHPAVLAEAGSILHAEQQFRWLRPVRIGEHYQVTATLERLRRRGGTTFVWLDTRVVYQRDRVLESGSMFLLTFPNPGRAEPEPAAAHRARSDASSRASLPEVGAALPALHKSASRADLVRYAAATGDWNPIHWDHDAAVEAGQAGVICHGLLMASWVLQAAARLAPGELPLSSARLRFKAPLRPATQALVVGSVDASSAGTTSLKMAVTSAETEHVAATVNVTTG